MTEFGPFTLWPEVGDDFPRAGSFSSTHWIHGTGDSEIAPYNEHSMYLDVVGESKFQNSAMRLGLLFERPIAMMAAEKISKHLQVGQFSATPCNTRAIEYRGVSFRDTCDFSISQEGDDVFEEKFGLEIKTISSFQQKSLWGDEWTDQVPRHVYHQCQAHMVANDFNQCFIAAWFYTPNEPTIYVVDREGDEYFLQTMGALVSWHNEHVEAKEPLPVDASGECTKYLNLVNQFTEDMTHADENDMSLMTAYVMAKKQHMEAKENLDLLKNQMRDRIGESAGISFGDYGHVKWSKGKTRRLTDNLTRGDV